MRAALILVVVAVAIAGCSIQPEAAPNDLPAERANVFGDDEIERASHSLQEETGIPVEVVRPEAEHEHVAKAT